MIRTAHTTLQTNQYPKAQNSSSGFNSTSTMYSEESNKDSSTSDGVKGSDAPPRVWKTAVDPKTGRTYYYDAVTRETQWRKPLELASEEEKRTMARKEKKQKDFFAAMEANIMKNMAAGSLVPVLRASSSMEGEQEEARDNIGELFRSKGNASNVEQSNTKGMAPGSVSTGKRSSANPAGNPKPKPQPLLKKPQMVRTISSMDDNVLAELTRVEKGPNDETADIKRRVSPTSVSVTGKENRYFERRDSASSEEGDIPSHFVQLRVSTSEEEEDMAIEEVRRVAKVMSELDVHNDSAFSAPPKSLPSSGPRLANNKGLLVKPTLAKPKMRKRNTCGTLYVGSTMSAPDKDATIKCIAGVYRAHLLQSAMDQNPPVKFEEYEIFNDWEKDHPRNASFLTKNSNHSDVFNLSYGLPGDGCYHQPFETSKDSEICSVPTLEEITNFYRDVFRKSQMESDCIIMSLIYVERLIKVTNGGVRPRSCNWRSILFSAMILSSKVWDDLSMWNADFSQCVSCPPGVTFSVQRINELERAVLSCLKYNVKVSASEYAKYYFLLRSMLIRSGLAGDDLNSLSPLDVEGARQLELRSSTVPALLPSTGSSSGGDSPGSNSGSPICEKPSKICHSRRAKSMSDAADLGLPDGCDGNLGSGIASKGRSPTRSSASNASARANLEQVVQM